MTAARNTFILLLLVGIVLSASDCPAQNADSEKLNEINQQRWERMLKLTEVELPDSLPPAADDPNRPTKTFKDEESGAWTDSAGNHYARGPWGKWTNYDESKANPYSTLPDPLILNNGRKVSTPEIWWQKRRPEIKKAFNEEIYGKLPEGIPDVDWQVVAQSDTTVDEIPARKKELIGEVDNSSYPQVSVEIQLTLVTPLDVQKPVPVMMYFGFDFPPGFELPPSFDEWKSLVLQKGWGYVTYIPISVQPDHAAGLTEGIIGLVNEEQLRSPDAWGALRAWAWGASRSLDYLETDPMVRADKVGVEGVSRYGKAALLTMAYDQRFAIALVGSSGKGGATLYRRNFGETVGILSSPGEYHWFAGEFIKYAGSLDADDLPTDSHELIAMCAPRPVFISTGSPEVEGRWIDGRGQFMATSAAGPVYQLLGGEGLGSQSMPAIGTALVDGDLAYRRHSGGHTTAPNWPTFLKFAEKYVTSDTSN